jgi:hypothetical protein
MSTTSLSAAIPADFAKSSNSEIPLTPEEVKTQILSWKSTLRNNRRQKVNLWDECWQLYRGVEDWTDKEDWQSKLIIPKSWNSVKQATNVIKRLLSSSPNPWSFEPINPDDLAGQTRSQQSTDLVRVFMDMAKYKESFSEGLECGFIMGLGVWKMWWGLVPRTVTQVQQVPQMGPNGQPVMGRQLIQQDILEGRLFIRAVDPYNFYWLPGSKLNQWVGTLEEIEIPKWELWDMVEKGILDAEVVEKASTSRINPDQDRRRFRFDEPPAPTSTPNDVDMIKLTEYYGPLVKNNRVIEKYAHVILAGDIPLLVDRNPYLHRKAPYIGFSPLSLPFRTEGVGLIENVRSVDRAINKLANLSMDTLLFRLLPVFEVPLDVYENPEDFETGLHPGKIFRRTQAGAGIQGLTPITFEDISSGTVQVAGQLDRAHQEGALVSEIQQALPRFRGAQTAAEIEIKNDNSQSFFGNMAVDIEEQGLKPMLEMAWELIFQFIDTNSDPRIASILGQGAEVLRGMTKEEIQEMIQGDYEIKVSGISGQLEKAEMLQNLTQFMNIIGQNSEAWAPYINQSELLRRIMEAFRPGIRDIEKILAEPATIEANKAAMQAEKLAPEQMAQQVAMIDMALRQQQEQAKAQAEAQQAQFQQRLAELELEKKEAEIELMKAKAAAARSPKVST